MRLSGHTLTLTSPERGTVLADCSCGAAAPYQRITQAKGRAWHREHKKIVKRLMRRIPADPETGAK